MKNRITKIKTIIAGALLFAATSSNAQTWNTTGNAGTDPSTNFVGTTDAKALRIRTNNQSRMTITSGGNVGIGTTTPLQKLHVNGSIKASAIVYAPAFQLDSGGNSFQWNTAYGWGNHATAGYLTTETDPKIGTMGFNGVPHYDGTQLVYGAIWDNGTNVGIGTWSLAPNAKLTVDGEANINYITFGRGGGSLPENTAAGYKALANNATGVYNTACGYNALLGNISGFDNSAYGFNSLKSNTSGNFNSAVGTSALANNLSGSYNTAVGIDALYYNKSGDANSALGTYALYSHKSGDYNTAIGGNAMAFDTSGFDNCAVGYSALYKNTKGNSNSAFGCQALYYNDSGVYNTSIGKNSGFGAASVKFNNCTFVGAYSFPTVYRSNVTMLGYGIANAQCTGNNQVLLGNTSVSQIRAQVTGITAYSDGRYKTNVKKDVKGLDFINLLNPVSYNVKPTELHKIWGTPDSVVKMIDHSETEKVRYTGFIAQDVEKAMRESGYDFTGIDIPKNDHENYALRYTEFIMPLVKAVQELDTKNNALAEENAQLKKDIAEIKAALNIKSTEFKIEDAQTSNSKITVSPNPFNESTTIYFEVQKEVLAASIEILSLDGRQLKSIAVNDSGNVIMNISANELSSGTYIIKIVADGKIMGSQKISCVK